MYQKYVWVKTSNPISTIHETIINLTYRVDNQIGVKKYEKGVTKKHKIIFRKKMKQTWTHATKYLIIPIMHMPFRNVYYFYITITINGISLLCLEAPNAW